MPISNLSSTDANTNLRKNRRSIWPDGRKSKGRLGNYTVCDSTPSFAFSRDDLIFTTGSCFARNIERTLDNQGFKLPMMDIECPIEERVSASKNEIVNKYTTSAVLNELRWGLGLEEFPADALLEVGDGLFHDPHLHPNVPPVSRERALERRQQIHDIVGLLPQCRVFIMTLGLVETWYDEKAGLYLNGAPPREAVAREPERFRFRRQSYSDIQADLQAIHDILSKHGHPDVKFILSVSPVPFKATYTGQDALAANCYSKSVLRAAAEEFVAAHDNVDYFPSYEMVTLSDRSHAFKDDFIHVREEMVGRIMDHAIARYVTGGKVDDTQVDLAQYGSKPRQIFAAGKLAKESGDYALASALLQLIDDNSWQAACDVPAAEFYLLYGVALARAGRNADAEPHLARAAALSPDEARPVFKLGLIGARLRRSYAIDCFERAAALDPGSAGISMRLAIQYERVKRPQDALKAYERTLALEPAHEEARAAADRLRPTVGRGVRPIAAAALSVRVRTSRLVTSIGSPGV
jgi:Flp pilus assembly protein TadD